jgi:HSP20 family protein
VLESITARAPSVGVMASSNNPFEALERMFERMSQQFEDAARTWDQGETLEFLGGGEAMALDLVDHDDEFVVTVNIPGFTKDEIDVQLTDRTLHVEAEHESETTEEKERYLRREREHRRLSRSIRLPEDVDAEDIAAKMNNGVLTITIPKAEHTPAGRKIEIE